MMWEEYYWAIDGYTARNLDALPIYSYSLYREEEGTTIHHVVQHNTFSQQSIMLYNTQHSPSYGESGNPEASPRHIGQVLFDWNEIKKKKNEYMKLPTQALTKQNFVSIQKTPPGSKLIKLVVLQYSAKE